MTTIPFRVCPVCFEKFITKAVWIQNTFPAMLESDDPYKGYEWREDLIDARGQVIRDSRGRARRKTCYGEIAYRRHDGCTGIMGDEGQEIVFPTAPVGRGNAKKEVCKQGHPFSGDNVAFKKQARGGTMRVCRECARLAIAKHRALKVVA